MNHDNVLILKDLLTLTSHLDRSEISVSKFQSLKQEADTKTSIVLVSGVPIDSCTKLATHTTVSLL